MDLSKCGVGCDTELAPVDFSICKPTVEASEIVKIYVAKADHTGFLDAKKAEEWVKNISNTSDEATAIRELTVIADKPADSSTTKELSNNRTIVIDKTFTLNVTIDDVTDLNYDFMRQTECGISFKIWYETKGGYLYGGNEGIVASLLFSYVLNRGKGEIGTITGTITWDNQFSPDRFKSPIGLVV